MKFGIDLSDSPEEHIGYSPFFLLFQVNGLARERGKLVIIKPLTLKINIH